MQRDENAIVFKQLAFFISIRKIPNIIFHGSSGSGKRTIVHDFINKIYNNDRARIKTNVMFVNCAHGKGIKFIREELKYFAKANIQCNDNNLFKSIVLYNADDLTIDAQSALRRCIELFSHNTRFFIVVENKYKLLKPILSRFCEIYVPDKKLCDDPTTIKYKSLHTVGLENTYSMETEKRDKRILTIGSQLKTVVEAFSKDGNADVDHIWFMNISTSLYEEGVSAMDIIKYLDEDLNIPELHTQLIRLKFCFNKIKGEFRCEKMLMMYLFDFLFLRSNPSLKNVSFL
jgi:DNA polymerase III delta prime subunit